MKGVELNKNRSGFTILKIHYTADPNKDPETQTGKLWLNKVLQGIPGGITSAHWRKEMEIDFSALCGTLVFEDYLKYFDAEIACDPFEIPEWSDIYASMDYGHRNPTAINFY